MSQNTVCINFCTDSCCIRYMNLKEEKVTVDEMSMFCSWFCVILIWKKKNDDCGHLKKNVMGLLVFGYQMWIERKMVQLKMSVFSLQQLLWILIDFGFHWTSKPVSKFYACQFFVVVIVGHSVGDLEKVKQSVHLSWRKTE